MLERSLFCSGHMMAKDKKKDDDDDNNAMTYSHSFPTHSCPGGPWSGQGRGWACRCGLVGWRPTYVAGPWWPRAWSWTQWAGQGCAPRWWDSQHTPAAHCVLALRPAPTRSAGCGLGRGSGCGYVGGTWQDLPQLITAMTKVSNIES